MLFNGHLILVMMVVAPGQMTLMNSLMSSSPSPLTSPTANRASISLLVNLDPDFLSSSCQLIRYYHFHTIKSNLTQHPVSVMIHLLEQKPRVVNIVHVL